MALLRIAEVFGHAVEDHTAQAALDRKNKRCPFKNARCTKNGKSNPLAVCSMSDGQSLAALCPIRFYESDRIFKDVGKIAFGEGREIVAAPEVHVLRVNKPSSGPNAKSHRVGKVDFLVASIDDTGKPNDFVALEVQAVYFSGGSIRPGFKAYLKTGSVPNGFDRRPDWRSSAQKRLIPQLALKVPIFRRWGKKFFVAVDSWFFDSLPRMKEASNYESGEITWMVYSFTRQENAYPIQAPRIVHTTWDDVQTALREGVPPTTAEVLGEVARKLKQKKLPILKT